MPFPAGLTLVSVHGRFDTPPSGGASGIVHFTSSVALLGSTDNSIIPPVDITVSLDSTGQFTTSLPATNDPDWTPVNWSYAVHATIGAASIRGTLQLDYQTTTVELADLLQIDGAASTGTTYIPLSQRGAANGVASLDAGTKVPAAQIPDLSGTYLSLTGGTVTGVLVVQDTGATKAYRYKTTGASLDLDATGADLYLSNFSAAGFAGTQHVYLRLESGAQLAHALGRWLFASGAFDGTGVADLDASTGVAAIGAKNGLANIQFCGFKATSGAPTTGTWNAGDLVLDSTKTWRLCTVGGTPGTWI